MNFDTISTSFSLKENIRQTFKFNHKLFPTLVADYNNFLEHAQCKKIFDCLKNTEVFKSSAFIGDGLSTHKKVDEKYDFNFDIIKQIQSINGLFYIKEKLMWAISEFEKDFGTSQLELDNSWFNVQQPGSMLSCHNHPGSPVSGVLYINVNKDSSPLVFENPNNLISYTLSTDKETEFNDEKKPFIPKIGSLLLFPGWLLHGSGKHTNNSVDRMVVSFNTRYKKKA